VTRIAVNGVHYHVERAGAGRPLVLLHGFTGSTASWRPLIPALTEVFETIAIDLLGHGGTDAPNDPARYRAEQVVRDLDALMEQLEIGEAVWLGYSMGARATLQFATECPERVVALVLESGSPGIADPAEREARARSDGALADRIERDGIEAFVDLWERLPLFASHRRLPSGVRAGLRWQRLANDPVGLANSLRGFGQGVQPSQHGRLGKLRMPALLIAGEEDAKYRLLAEAMAREMLSAEVALIADVGHTPHLEQPDTFIHTIQEFLARLERRDVHSQETMRS
jgi:2-succinyl-6-hydroxy-2,4-cyclohexadiene-1-carboxylate synthase